MPWQLRSKVAMVVVPSEAREGGRERVTRAVERRAMTSRTRFATLALRVLWGWALRELVRVLWKQSGELVVVSYRHIQSSV